MAVDSTIIIASYGAFLSTGLLVWSVGGFKRKWLDFTSF